MPQTILLKIGIGYHRGHPLQSMLIIIGIALGVAVIVAIDIANTSISRSFQYSTESLTGKTTHQIIGSQVGFSQTVYRDLRVKLGYRKSAPIVEGFIQVKELGMKTVKLMGVDPFSEIHFRNFLGVESDVLSPNIFIGIMAEPDRVMISEQLAEKRRISAGGHLTLLNGGRSNKVEVFGLMKSQNNLTQNVLSGVIITDIATAQEILKTGDHINRIDLIITEDQEDDVLRTINRILPAGVTTIPARKKNASIRQMSSAFELNLTAMSLLALLVGMFLIYNTITFSVIQRRKLLGILRALGTARSEIFFMIIGETLILGAIGSLLGVSLGVLLGLGTVQLVSRTISDLYFVLSVSAFAVSPCVLIKGLGIGMLACFISALFPAYEAVRVPPVVTQRRSSLEKYATGVLPLLTSVGLLLLVSGSAILNIQTRQLEFSFSGLLFIVFGTALLVPYLSKILIYLVLKTPGINSRLGAKMALRNVSRSLSRTAVAIAALMIAVSVIIGVGIMVGSFRYTVVSWLKNTIIADIYVVGVNRNNPDLDPAIPQILEGINGLKAQYPMRSFKINSGDYAGTTVFVIEKEIIQRKWIWKSGTDEAVYGQFATDSIFVSENFAWKNRISEKNGNRVILVTNQGNKSFSIAGIFQDFSSRQGMIVMNAQIYRRFWNDSRLSGIGLIVEPGVIVSEVIDQVNQRLSDKHQYIISSNADIRRSAIDVFDRTFTITIALQILAALVAFIGVFNSIMSMMLERTKEVGILRANGMTIGQLWRMILAESGIIGCLSGLLALPLGTTMAWILVSIINKRSFGWTLEFIVEPYHYWQAIGIALIASITAGFYPSYIISKKEIVDALRTE